jgi:hypothetical protein
MGCSRAAAVPLAIARAEQEKAKPHHSGSRKPLDEFAPPPGAFVQMEITPAALRRPTNPKAFQSKH